MKEKEKEKRISATPAAFSFWIFFHTNQANKIVFKDQTTTQAVFFRASQRREATLAERKKRRGEWNGLNDFKFQKKAVSLTCLDRNIFPPIPKKSPSHESGIARLLRSTILRISSLFFVNVTSLKSSILISFRCEFSTMFQTILTIYFLTPRIHHYTTIALCGR